MNKPTLLLSLVVFGVVAVLAVFLLPAPEAGSDAPGGGTLAAGDTSVTSSTVLADAPSSERPAEQAPTEERAIAADRTELVTGSSRAAAESAGPFLLGRVVDQSGAPVVDAEVRISNGTDIEGPGAVRVIGALASRSKSGSTDATGSFRIEDLGLDEISITVRADGYAPLDTDGIVLGESGGADRFLEDLVMQPGVVLVGRVLDDRGSPVVGAEISVVDPEDGSLVFTLGKEPTPDAISAEDGSFEVPRLAVGPWALQVDAESHPLRVFKGMADLPGVQPSLTLEVPRGVPIEGFAVGVPEALMDRIEVRAQPASAVEFMPFGNAGGATAALASDGTFKIEGLDPAQVFVVELIDPESGAFSAFRGLMGGGGASRSESFETAPGVNGVELVFRTPASLLFEVVDASTGQPLERFTATIGLAFNERTLDGPDGEPQTVHPGGRAVFPDLYAQDFELFFEDGLELRVDADEYASTSVEIESLVDGEQTDLGVIELRPAPALEVIVLDHLTREPIKNAKVSLRVQPDEDEDDFVRFFGAAQQQRKAKTGADGRAVVTSFPGRPSRLEVDKSGRAPVVEFDVLIEDVPVQRTVLLGPGGEVVVRVVDDAGAAVGGAEVQHRLVGEDDTRARKKTSSRRGARFRDLEPGVHEFRVSREGDDGRRRWRRRAGGDDDQGWQRVDVEHDSEAELTLVVTSTLRAVGVVREGGRPLSGADISIISLPEDPDERERRLADARSGRWWGGNGEQGTTGADGSWEIDGLEAGELAAIVRHPDRATAWVEEFELLRDEQRLDLDLPVTVVKGRIVDPDGAPVAGIEVVARLAGRAGRGWNGRGWNPLEAMGVEVVEVGGGPVGVGPTVDGRTGADGRFELRGLEPGVSLVLRASAPTVVTAVSESFELEADQVRDDFELTVTPAGSLEITFEMPPGSVGSMRFASVRAELIQDDPEAEEVTRDEWSWRAQPVTFEGLQPGRWRLTAQSEMDDVEASSEPLEVDVVSGETRDVTLVLR